MGEKSLQVVAMTGWVTSLEHVTSTGLTMNGFQPTSESIKLHFSFIHATYGIIVLSFFFILYGTKSQDRCVLTDDFSKFLAEF